MPNRLADETSPYLLQHKDNPVDWYPWGEEALGRARAEDKPILVSIGYSACHWCHVMEHESFSDPGTAQLMNDAFVCVKVDREERPDIDQIYMGAVQAMSGQGGWPLNVFLTPEGVPFFGGTYWPPYDARGMPGFRRVLQAVGETFRERRADVEENADRLRQHLGRAMSAVPDPGEVTTAMLDTAVRALHEQFDPEHGGFGRAPKFPQPMVLDFLLRQAHRDGSADARNMVRVTLDRMAAGGMYDHLGGGFHRYSVDAVWLVPHFEKMLYDNAQLARIYLDAARAFGDDGYRRVAEETLDYVAREMTGPEGGFYSAQDADSEGEEGRFFVWTPARIDAVLGPEEGAIVRAWYGVTDRGNFEGRNILHRPMSAGAIDAALGDVSHEVERIVAAARLKLLAEREKRVHPGRDDKVIASWNGMMLRAMAEGGRVLRRRDLLDVARRNGAFLLDRMLVDGRLARTWKDGQSKGTGFLEDYANVADGLLALYQATFERRWLDAAIDLAERALSLFEDPDGPMLYDTGAGHEELVVRPRDYQDGATPSGNAVVADVLLILADLTGRERYRERADAIVATLAELMAQVPIGFGRMLAAADRSLASPREVTFAGPLDAPGLAAMLDLVWSRYDPNAVLAWSDPADPKLPGLLPLVADRPARDGRATAYVCQNHACLPPVTDIEGLGGALQRQA